MFPEVQDHRIDLALQRNIIGDCKTISNEISPLAEYPTGKISYCRSLPIWGYREAAAWKNTLPRGYIL